MEFPLLGNSLRLSGFERMTTTEEEEGGWQPSP